MQSIPIPCTFIPFHKVSLAHLIPLHSFDAIVKSQNAPSSNFSPTGGAYSAPRPPSWWGGGLLPPRQDPFPALGPSGLAISIPTFYSTAPPMTILFVCMGNKWVSEQLLVLTCTYVLILVHACDVLILALGGLVLCLSLSWFLVGSRDTACPNPLQVEEKCLKLSCWNFKAR